MSIVFIISAPSGSGKSTLVKKLMDKDKEAEARLQFSVSVTTREAREGEVDGRDYRFLTKKQFLDLREQDGLLEWAEVFGNYYGTSREVLHKAEREGKDLILDIDVQGAAQLREKIPSAVTIFILPPSRQELEARLRRRSSDADEVIERRLDGAAEEVLDYERYDYVLVNDNLTKSFERLRGILLAERCRVERNHGLVKRIVDSFRQDKP